MMNNMHEKYEWLKRIPLLALVSLLSLAFDAGPVYAQDSDGDSVADSVDLDDDNDGILDVAERPSPDVTTWINQVGGITAVGNTLHFSSSAPSSWNSTLTSLDFSALGVSGTYTVSFTPDQGNIRSVMIGLNKAGQNSGTSTSWSNIDHAMYLRSDGILRIYESGSNKHSSSYSAGDLLSIEVTGSTLKYKRNGSTLRTKTITSGQDFYIDTAFPGGAPSDYTISNVQLDSGGTAVSDTDGDGIPDHLDTDSDGDGVSDLIESGQAQGVVDTDNDGRHDGSVDSSGVPNAASGGVTPVDSDNDQRADVLDLDSDNDGVLDADESFDPRIMTWINQVGGVTASGNTLSFDDDNWSGAWNSTIHSLDFSALGVAGGFEFSFVSDISPVWKTMIGLNKAGNNSTASYSDIDHAIYLNKGKVLVFENGANQGNFGTFSANDRFSITVDGGSLKYKQNGVTFLSRAVTPGLDYYVDSSFLDSGDNVNYSLSDIRVRPYDGIRDSDGDGVADRLDIDSDGDSITDMAESGQDSRAYDTNTDGRHDGGVDNDGVPVDAAGGKSLVDSDLDLVFDILDWDSDNDGILDNIEGPGNPDVLAWKNQAGGLTASGNNLNLDFGTTSSGWSSTIHSEDFSTLGVGGDFAFSFTAENHPCNYFFLGINQAGNNSTASYSDIDHAVYLRKTGFRLFENGSQVLNAGSWSAGDRFSIVREGSQIIYKRNGAVVHTSSVIGAGTDFYIDSSMHSSGSGLHTISDVEVVGEFGHPRDSDGDGYADYIDTDSDNDTISDLIESGQDWEVVDVDEDGVHDSGVDEHGVPVAAAGGVVPVDTDADGIIDVLDFDSDSDGIPDQTEGYADPDNDGIPNFQDLDSDGDGIPDAPEVGDYAQLFYVPVEDELARTAFDHYESGNVDLDQYGVVSITATADGTLLYYDQWEDGGYDLDITTPINVYSTGNLSGTQIWGDGDDANGKPPGFASDFINLGDVILLENLVPIPRDAADLRFDGGDKFAVTEPVAVTRASWNDEAKALLAGALEVYDTSAWGVSYSIPLSEDYSHSDQIFQYVALMIMASQDNTVVNIDEDADGSSTVITLDEGESVLVCGNMPGYNNVVAGGQINATHPVQVEMITGSTYSRYQSRWYHITPTENWSCEYFNPVASLSGDDRSDVFVYNPHPFSITVKYERLVNGSSSINTYSVDPTTTRTIPINSLNTAQRFYTENVTDTFYAFVAVDAVTRAGTHDWGLALVPNTSLSPALQIGWGPGRDALSTTSPNGNYNPVWVTAVADTTVFIDFNGDGGPISNGCGTWDTSVSVDRLESVRIFDPDGDQTQMKLQTCDGTPITAAWGQDTSVAPGAQPALDMGTTVPPLPLFATSKSVAHAPGGDLNGDGEFNPGDTIRYTIEVSNPAYVLTRQLQLSDTLPPSGATYVTGSTFRGGIFIPDAGSTPFPLDEGDYAIGVLASQEVMYFRYDMALDYPWTVPVVTLVSEATVSDAQNTFTPSVSVPVVLSPELTVTVTTTTPEVCIGDTAQFSVTVENTGDTILSNIGSSSALASGCDQVIGTLNIGESVSYSCSKANVSAAFLNTVVAAGDVPGGQTTSGIGSVQVNLQPPATISGTVVKDLNANGQVDGGEGGLSGATVSLSGPSGSFQVTTGSSGNFTFTDLKQGTYTLTRANPPAWISSAALPGTVGATVVSVDEISVVVAPDDTSSNNRFLSYVPSTISGTVYDELVIDGVVGAGEGPLAGAIITLTAPGFSEQVTTTGDGTYEFDDLEADTYVVNIIPPANHGAGSAVAGTIGAVVDAADQITVVLPQSSDSEDNNFFNYEQASISGVIYEDGGADGVEAASAPPILGVVLSLYTCDDVFITSTASAADGSYA
ncbi:MAG: SdrD B-like domain-containing protein, partial [Verrucomicrobiota bacterium]